MQYTLRNVPKQLDRILREEARRENKSLNDVLIAALMRAFGIQGKPAVQRDVSDIAGTWQADPAMERILQDQRRIDPDMWR